MPSSSKTFTFPEVRIVEASAGSGKTFCLARRYVRLLLNPDLDLDHVPVRNILAITFTNKAAFEMKARIIEFLKSLALGIMDENLQKDILGPLNISEAQAREKACRIIKEIIGHYNFFQVQTIDKFVNALLSSCAFKLGLTANFKIKTNTSEYLQYALNQLIDRSSGDPATRAVFEDFLHNYLYLENRSGWFPKKDMLDIVSALYYQNCSLGEPFIKGPVAGEEIAKKKVLILNEIKNLYAVLPEKTHAAFRKNLEKFLSKERKGFDIDQISNYFARDEFPVTKGGEVPPDVEQLWELIRLNLRLLCQQESLSLFNPYIDIFNAAAAGFDALCSRDDVMFLEQLNKKAGALFDERHVTVQELYYRLAMRFRHYLIDEFQDTSRLQWNNLKMMVEEALSTRGSLFYVGDRKQAIYSFRGGDSGLFDEIAGAYENFRVRREHLAKNWRSQKAIVEFNNHIFSVDNLRTFIAAREEYGREKKKDHPVVFSEKDFKVLENIFRSSAQEYREDRQGGYVCCEHIEGVKKDDRDIVTKEKVTQRIKELSGRMPLGDIAVLVRNNNQVEAVTGWLLEQGFAVESERTLNVMENPLIKDVLCFLNFLNSPVDNLSLAAFLLSDVFLKASGLKKGEVEAFLFSLREQSFSGYIYVEFRRAFPEIWEKYINDFFRNVGLYPLYELIVSFYDRFQITVLFPESRGFFMHFLDVIKAKEEEYQGLSGFLEYFQRLQGEDLYVRTLKTDAVKVLTIHKSKGLEFPAVILPFLGMDVQVGFKSSDNKQSYVLNPGEGGLQLLKLKEKYYKFSGKLYEIYAREYKQAILDELNNVYVALTRACEELYVYIPEKTGARFNEARFLFSEGSYHAGNPGKTSEKKDPKESFDLESPAFCHWISFLKDEHLTPRDVQNREVRARGEIVHAVLSLIKRGTPQNLSGQLTQALKQVEARYPYFPEYDGLESQLKTFLSHKNIQPFFTAKDEVWTEKEIVDAQGVLRRVDRLHVGSAECRVVDFKTSLDTSGRQEEQIKEYMRMVGALYPEKTVKGFLIALETCEVREVKG